jgi:hypothetical protein
MPLEILALLGQAHPLTAFAWLALFGFIWGSLAALGANVGYRRGLVWQTGFLLGILFSGILFAVYYSIRPLTHEGPVSIPKWVKLVAVWPSIVLAAISVILSVILEVFMRTAPVVLLHSPWVEIEASGLFFAALGLLSFTALGGYFGKLWYDRDLSTND